MARPHDDIRLADPGALLATTHEVGGGLRVRLRLARPSDGGRVAAFLERLSPESRRRRFFAEEDDRAAMVRRFTFFAPQQRLVVAATVLTTGGEEIVGLADVTLLDTGQAELGVVVDDAHQGRGVGRLLAEVVADLALRQGAERLTGELAEDDPAMVHLMERLGRTVRTVEDGRTVIHTRISARRRRAA